MLVSRYTPQEFVDMLNHKTMPQFGYKLIKEGGLYYWVYSDCFGEIKRPANEETRKAIRNANH